MDAAPAPTMAACADGTAMVASQQVFTSDPGITPKTLQSPSQLRHILPLFEGPHSEKHLACCKDVLMGVNPVRDSEALMPTEHIALQALLPSPICVFVINPLPLIVDPPSLIDICIYIYIYICVFVCMCIHMYPLCYNILQWNI